MQRLLFTPTRRRAVALLAILLYLTAPTVYFADCWMDLWLRPNPNADSWEIFWRWHLPLFVAVLAAFAPVFALLIWLALRDYPGRVSLLTFNRVRPVWTITWSLPLGGLAMVLVGDALVRLRWGLVAGGVYDLIWAYLVLCLRCSVVHGRLFAQRARRAEERGGVPSATR